MDSRDLIRRLRASSPGDPLWQEFVARCRAVIRAVVWRRTGGQGLGEDVRDVEQEVFRRLLARDRQRLKEFDGLRSESFEGYVRRVADSVLVDWFRRERVGENRLLPLSPEVIRGLEKSRRRVFGGESAIRPEHDLRMREVEETVRAYLDTALTDPRDRALSRRIYQLHFQEGYSIQQIARLRAVPLSTSAISRRAHAMRLHLQRVLDPDPES